MHFYKNKINLQNNKKIEKIDLPLPPEFLPKENETKEELKIRKKAIKEYQRKKRIIKKDIKQKFISAKSKVSKSITASCCIRGQTVYNLN